MAIDIDPSEFRSKEDIRNSESTMDKAYEYSKRINSRSNMAKSSFTESAMRSREKTQREISSVSKMAMSSIAMVSKSAMVGMKNTVVSATKMTGSVLADFSKKISEDMNVNKGNLVAGSLSKISPVIGYFVGKMVETPAFQNIFSKMKEKISGAASRVRNSFRKRGGRKLIYAARLAQRPKGSVSQYVQQTQGDTEFEQSSLLVSILQELKTIRQYTYKSYIFQKASTEAKMNEKGSKGKLSKKTIEIARGEENIPHLSKGGFITKSGLARVHAGEVVMSANQMVEKFDEISKTLKELKTGEVTTKRRKDQHTFLATTKRLLNVMTLNVAANRKLNTYIKDMKRDQKEGFFKSTFRALSESYNEHTEPANVRQLRALLEVRDAIGAKVEGFKKFQTKMLDEHPFYRKMVLLTKLTSKLVFSPISIFKWLVKKRGKYSSDLPKSKNFFEVLPALLGTIYEEAMFRFDKLIDIIQTGPDWIKGFGLGGNSNGKKKPKDFGEFLWNAIFGRKLGLEGRRIGVPINIGKFLFRDLTNTVNDVFKLLGKSKYFKKTSEFLMAERGWNFRRKKIVEKETPVSLLKKLYDFIVEKQFKIFEEIGTGIKGLLSWINERFNGPMDIRINKESNGYSGVIIPPGVTTAVIPKPSTAKNILGDLWFMGTSVVGLFLGRIVKIPFIQKILKSKTSKKVSSIIDKLEKRLDKFKSGEFFQKLKHGGKDFFSGLWHVLIGTSVFAGIYLIGKGIWKFFKGWGNASNIFLKAKDRLTTFEKMWSGSNELIKTLTGGILDLNKIIKEYNTIMKENKEHTDKANKVFSETIGKNSSSKVQKLLNSFGEDGPSQFNKLFNSGTIVNVGGKNMFPSEIGFKQSRHDRIKLQLSEALKIRENIIDLSKERFSKNIHDGIKIGDYKLEKNLLEKFLENSSEEAKKLFGNDPSGIAEWSRYLLDNELVYKDKSGKYKTIAETIYSYDEDLEIQRARNREKNKTSYEKEVDGLTEKRSREFLNDIRRKCSQEAAAMIGNDPSVADTIFSTLVQHKTIVYDPKANKFVTSAEYAIEEAKRKEEKDKKEETLFKKAVSGASEGFEDYKKMMFDWIENIKNELWRNRNNQENIVNLVTPDMLSERARVWAFSGPNVSERIGKAIRDGHLIMGSDRYYHLPYELENMDNGQFSIPSESRLNEFFESNAYKSFTKRFKDEKSRKIADFQRYYQIWENKIPPGMKETIDRLSTKSKDALKAYEKNTLIPFGKEMSYDYDIASKFLDWEKTVDALEGATNKVSDTIKSSSENINNVLGPRITSINTNSKTNVNNINGDNQSLSKLDPFTSLISQGLL